MVAFLDKRVHTPRARADLKQRHFGEKSVYKPMDTFIIILLTAYISNETLKKKKSAYILFVRNSSINQ